jgi:UTP-glucose-1-phosphate uridylyltransferase
VTGHRRARIVVAAGGLGTRASAWSRYLPKEFYPVDGRPGIAWLLDEIAGLGPAETVIIYHPYYEEFAAWARTALSRDGQDRYRRASGTAGETRAADLNITLIPQNCAYADLTSVLNGADHLGQDGSLYVAFADNLYRGTNPLLDLRATPPGSVAVLARAYQREQAASRGVITVVPQHGQLVMAGLAEKPDPLVAQALEQRHGIASLMMLEGRARITPGFIRFARSYQAPAGTEPKLALAIAAYARTRTVIVTPTTSEVIDLGTRSPAKGNPDGQYPAPPAPDGNRETTAPREAPLPWQLTHTTGQGRH